MKGRLKRCFQRLSAMILATVTIFSQVSTLDMSVFAAGTATVQRLETNPFYGLTWTSKKPIENGSYNADIMAVTIDGKQYIAYCLNHDRYGSGDKGSAYGTYSVQVYDVDDPSLESNVAFQNDKNLLYKMQGVASSGGYLGGGDEAAKQLKSRYGGTLFADFNNPRFVAYAVTKYTMWTAAEANPNNPSATGQPPGQYWKVNNVSDSYSAADHQKALQAMIDIYGSATNWVGFNNTELRPIPQAGSDGNIWQEGPEEGEHYVEWQIETSLLGNNKTSGSDHLEMDDVYTVTPAADLPAGFHLEKTDGTEIKSATQLAGSTVDAYRSTDKFRLVAESGTDYNSFGNERTVATVTTKVKSYPIKYGIAVPNVGQSNPKVQNYALMAVDAWEDTSVPITLSTVDTPTDYQFTIKKTGSDGALAGAEFRVENADGNWSTTVTTGSSGSILVKVPASGTYYVTETKAPAGYALDPKKHSVNVQNNTSGVTLEISNGKNVALQINKLDALTDEPLAGAVFTVEKIDGSFSTDVTTNDTGIAIVSGLEPGSYKITEKTPPAGYQPAENPVQTIELLEDQVNVPSVIYKNYPIEGTLKIKKTAVNNGDPLEGVTFEIKRQDGAEKWTVTTNAQGEAEIDLPADWYIVTEIDAPENVEIDSTPHTVKLEPGKEYELALTNVLKKTLIVEKRDTKTNELVPGMIFEIKSPEGDLFGAGNCGRGEGIYKVGEDGTLTFDNMETGTSWVITEVEAPPGYVLNPEPQTIKITEDVNTVSIRDDQKPGLLLTKVDSDTGKRIQGAKFTFTVPGTNQVYTEVTNNEGVIFLENLDVTAIVIQEIEPAPGYIANDQPVTIQLKPNERTDVTFKNTSKPGLRLKKIDTEGNPVADVVISVKKADGTSVGEYTTDEDGMIFIPNLEAGTYDVQEVSAPDLYVIDQTVHKITLAAGKIGEITLRNKIKPTIRIVKIDSVTKGPIEGVTFEVSVTDGGKIGDYVTDANGEILVTNLAAGTNYTIKEIKTLPGYLLDETPKQITPESDKITTVQFENKAKSPIYILKLDSETGKGIPGVRFKVTMADGSLVGEVTTDATGRATLTNAPAGYITVTEVAVPDGYVLDPTPQTKLSDGETPLEFTFYNTPYGNLLIKKHDAANDNPLMGAIFKVTTSDGTLIGDNYTTGADGTILIENLDPTKTYIVTETKAPEGYEISESAKTITIKAGQTRELIFRDNKYENFTIRKTDPDGNPIPGVTFLVSTIEGTEVDRVTTGKDGLAVLTGIEPGTYKVQEVSVPANVVMDDTPQVVTVKAGEPTTLTFVNEYRKVLTIKKIDTDGNPIPGVTFAITKLDGGLITNVTSDINGLAVLENLESGTYRVYEVAVPDGIVLNPVPQTIEFKAGTGATLTFVNEHSKEMVIRKTDPQGKPIAGVTFVIATLNGGEVARVTTGVDGLASVSNLKSGSYKVYEVAVPEGVVLDSTPQTVEFKEGTGVTLTFVNEYVKQFMIRKTDTDGKPVAGVTFVISTIAGAEIKRVTTGSDGLAVLTDIEPGTYKVQEISAPSEFIVDPTPQIVEVKAGEPTTLNFVNERVKEFIIRKTGRDGKPIAGVTFVISTLAGAEVKRVTTGSDGLVVLTDIEPGSYKVQEISVPDNVVLDPTPQIVTVVADKTTTVNFVNDYVGGLKIVKTVTQSGSPLKGVTFEIKKADGSLIGEYTTDENGEIFVKLDPMTVVVRETKAPSGYKVDSTPRTVEIKANEITQLKFENERLAGLIIQKIDADTKKPLYGARFLLMDSNYKAVAELVTDRDGYAELDTELSDGVYYIREIKAPDGYTLDERVKRIVIKDGATDTIVWENSTTRGQIQIIKKSADYNPVTGKPAGSLLEGAIFEIYNADTNVVVDRVVSDYRGVAASDPLPLGRYKIREITPPDYYQINNTTFEAQLKIPNDIVTIEVTNSSTDIHLTVQKQGNEHVSPGQQMRYDFFNIVNDSNVEMNNFFLHEEIPTSAVRLNTIHTGTWNQPGLSYKITYRTNLNTTYRDLATGLMATRAYDLDCSASKLGLASNEYITDIRFEFGTVKAGFREENRPQMLMTVLQNLPNGTRFANRVDVGGEYCGKWFSGDYTWVTQINAPPVSYPTTGY